MTTFDCARTRGAFDAWLDGALDAPDAETVSDHLVACALCATALADDLRFGAVLDDAVRVAAPSPVARPGESQPWFRRAAILASAASLLLSAFLVGRATTDDLHSNGRSTLAEADDDARYFDPPHHSTFDELGIFMPVAYAEAQFRDAEHDRLATRVIALELEKARIDFELSAIRSVGGAELESGAIVAELARVVRATPVAGRHDLWRRTRAAARLLERDPEGAGVAIGAWLENAETPAERRSAVRLLGMVQCDGAFEILVREAKDGAARDVALDGLLKARDERARPVFVEIAGETGVPQDLRIRALGGLHRLGDASAAERLVEIALSSEETSIRRKVVYHLAARPGAWGAELTALVDGAGIDAKERRLLAEFLCSSGGDMGRTLAERL